MRLKIWIWIFLIFIFNTTFLYSSSKKYTEIGVNLGGIYVLEDWFFSEKENTFLVDTHPQKRSAKAYKIAPDVNKNLTFFGECDLVHQLKSKENKTNKEIYNIFQQHRKNYLRNGNEDLKTQIKKLLNNIKKKGVYNVRLPITWCLRYPNKSYTIEGTYGKTTIRPQSTIVRDPYFIKKEMRWVVIPIEDIKIFLETAADLEMEVLLDIHTFPGGSSVGSYSGTWPEAPRFWNDISMAKRNMNTILSELFKWLEKEEQSKARKGLHGISPMNEPAHLSGIKDFYHQYPHRWENNKELRIQEIGTVLEEAIRLFKTTDFIENDKKLVINIIETSSIDFNENMWTVWQNWWGRASSKEDRQNWAVLDVHHYEAWTGLYEKNQENTLTEIKKKNWTKIYHDIRNQLVEDDELFYCSEFSASLNHNSKESHANPLYQDSILAKKINKNFYQAQVEAFTNNNIHAYFWTWDIPYNKNFQAEWSLKKRDELINQKEK